ncbi:hypothetical protein ACH5RR_011636 [Cinchona calisaya]|uniref:Uncharacterized protein n=1 Tax=Cinchona calisaya TaxID=153742 RepID=A0ABD3A930_9GENT
MRKPCCDKKHTNKGAWTKQEDQKLIDYIRTNGEGGWRTLPEHAGLHRCGKSCRLRWINYLSPDIKRGNFAEDEEDLIVKLHALLGNRWSLIAGRLPGRTDNEVKNYWNSHIRRKLINMGIDPNNHRLNQVQTPLLYNHPHQNEKHNQLSPRIKTSSGTRSKMIEEPNVCDDHQQEVSDAASSSINEDDETLLCSSSEPNLDLTIGFSPSSSILEAKQQTKPPELNLNVEVDQGERSPALILFL